MARLFACHANASYDAHLQDGLGGIPLLAIVALDERAGRLQRQKRTLLGACVPESSQGWLVGQLTVHHLTAIGEPTSKSNKN